MSRFNDQNPVLGREQINKAGFPCGMARSSIEEQMLVGFNHLLQAIETMVIEFDKIGIHKIHSKVGLGMQDAVRNIGRAWIGKKQPPAWFFRARHCFVSA